MAWHSKYPETDEVSGARQYDGLYFRAMNEALLTLLFLVARSSCFTYVDSTTLRRSLLLRLASMLRYLFVIFFIACLLSGICAQDFLRPIQVATSSKHYGPDGPWQAVSVLYGNPGQGVDLYPGKTYDSIILTTSMCEGISLLPCGSGGLFDPSVSDTLDTQSIQYSARNNGFDIDWTLGALRIGGSAHFAMDSLRIGLDHVANLSTRLIYNASIYYPDGASYPVQLGALSLGAAQAVQTFENITANLILGDLYNSKVISSASFGLHIGSAALGPPLSLWMGGYDPSRVLGSVASFSYGGDFNFFVVDLLDIGIGVDSGDSPFPYGERKGILADGNSSMPNALSVSMNPEAPYLALPESTCAAIAKDLPVTFNAKYGLYFWDVDDPQYTRIVTSPSYLSFEFRASSTSDATLAVNVPFRLLNLTLEAPLVDKPTPYFPCQPPQEVTDKFTLGRAFLQAAFIGVNWSQGSGEWYLAQAPGPNTPAVPSSNTYPDTFTGSSSSSKKWSDTWEGHWTPLPEKTNSSAPTPGGNEVSPPSGNEVAKEFADDRLSVGAKAGIGIGIAALLSILGGFFFLQRRYAHKPNAPLSESHQTEIIPKQDGLNVVHEAATDLQPLNSYRAHIAHEMEGDHSSYELEGGHNSYEMG